MIIKAQRLLGRGCEEILCNTVDTKTPGAFLKNIPVVQEFPDIFLNEISGMPPPREVEFCIDWHRESPLSPKPLINDPGRT